MQALQGPARPQDPPRPNKAMFKSTSIGLTLSTTPERTLTPWMNHEPDTTCRFRGSKSEFSGLTAVLSSDACLIQRDVNLVAMYKGPAFFKMPVQILYGIVKAGMPARCFMSLGLLLQPFDGLAQAFCRIMVKSLWRYQFGTTCPAMNYC